MKRKDDKFGVGCRQTSILEFMEKSRTSNQAPRKVSNIIRLPSKSKKVMEDNEQAVNSAIKYSKSLDW